MATALLLSLALVDDLRQVVTVGHCAACTAEDVETLYDDGAERRRHRFDFDRGVVSRDVCELLLIWMRRLDLKATFIVAFAIMTDLVMLISFGEMHRTAAMVLVFAAIVTRVRAVALELDVRAAHVVASPRANITRLVLRDEVLLEEELLVIARVPLTLKLKTVPRLLIRDTRCVRWDTSNFLTCHVADALAAREAVPALLLSVDRLRVLLLDEKLPTILMQVLIIALCYAVRTAEHLLRGMAL